jgi:hypothetical protein
MSKSSRVFLAWVGVLLSLLSTSKGLALDIGDVVAPWLEVLPPGQAESKPQHRGPLSVIFGNVPKGKLSTAIPPECSTVKLEAIMLGAKSPQAQAFQTQNFLSGCEKKFNPYPPSQILALVKLGEGNYPLDGYKNLREIILKLPYDVTIHGLLAFKDLVRPRPLLIMICGSACNLSNAVARVFLTEFFDVQPFNILIVPSLSGDDFIRDNYGFGIGGFEEGRQTFEIVRLLGGEDSPFRSLISSFHILGTSLGGNGALFAGTYGTYNNHLLTGPKVQSISALCPVVDLKESLLDLDRNDIVGRHFTSLITDAVIKNFALVLGAGHDVPTLYKAGHKQSVPFVEKYIYPRYKELWKRSEFPLAPFSQLDLDTPETFWKANNFLNYYSDVTIPTLAMYADDDFVVRPRSNSKALNRALEQKDNPLVNVIRMSEGSHCASSEIYGEDVVGGIVKNFVLSQSPEFNFAAGHKTLGVDQVEGAQKLVLAGSEEKFFGYNWSVHKGSDKAVAKIKKWMPSKRDSENSTCAARNPYYASLNCFDEIKIKVPLNNFFPDLDQQTVKSNAQAEQLTRWLNSRVRLLTKSGNEPVDTEEAPTSIDWTLD